MYVGVVKKGFEDKGYGFIAPPEQLQVPYSHQGTGQLNGIRLVAILQFMLDCPYSAHGYEGRALRAVCFNAWSFYNPEFSRQSLRASAARERRCREGEEEEDWMG